MTRQIRLGADTDQRTSVNDTVGVTVLESRADLPRKLPRCTLPQTPVRDDVVEELPSVHVLKDHVVVVWVDEHVLHAGDIRVMEQEDNRSFANDTDFLAEVLRVCFGEEGFGWAICPPFAGRVGRGRVIGSVPAAAVGHCRWPAGRCAVDAVRIVRPLLSLSLSSHLSRMLLMCSSCRREARYDFDGKLKGRRGRWTVSLGQSLLSIGPDLPFLRSRY